MKRTPPKHDRTEPRGWFSLFTAKGGWISWIAAAICLAVTVGSVLQYRAATAYDRTGVEAQAEAIDRRIVYDSEGSDDHYVTYRFAAGDRVITRERKVSRAQYNRANPGAAQTIRYLPDRPDKFETYVGQARDNAVVLQWVAGAAGVGGLIALWFVGSRANRAVLTRRFGYRTTVRVDRIVETKNSGRPSGKGYLVWYTDDIVRCESMTHPIGKLRAIGVGAEINIYVRKGHSVWEGDVGPQEVDDSRFPKVPR